LMERSGPQFLRKIIPPSTWPSQIDDHGVQAKRLGGGSQ
jgi:hypothetical protein